GRQQEQPGPDEAMERDIGRREPVEHAVPRRHESGAPAGGRTGATQDSHHQRRRPPAIAKAGQARHAGRLLRRNAASSNGLVMVENTGVVAIGEVMVELARGSDGRYSLAYGGDTFNTAVYLARAGVPVAYATALGDDPYSDGVAAQAAAGSVGGDLIVRVPRRMPGPPPIQADAHCHR